MQFSDHFAAVSKHYAAFRPGYPEDLYAWLAELAPERHLAWDCATGTGQAARGLAPHFDRVVATDASAAQIAAADPAVGVEFYVAQASASGLAEASVDLISVAQALHWFDLPAFYREAERVLRPDGVLAAWTYTRLECASPEAQRLLDTFYEETVGPYWPPQRRHVEAGYRDLDFPWGQMPAPAFQLERVLDLDALLGYLRSWSATARHIEARGEDPTLALGEALAPHWVGRPLVTWPLVLRVGRRPA
jgi:SAM-dependent methyltransferase